MTAVVPFLVAGTLLAAALFPPRLRAAEDHARPVAAADDDAIEVLGPTLIAFFPRLTAQRIESNPELVYLLDEFHEQLKSIGTTLVASGVRIYARPAGEIRILDGGRVRTLAPPPEGSDIGYYTVAPGLEAKLVLGFDSDVDPLSAMDRQPAPGVFRHNAPSPVAFRIEDGALHVFGHVLQPKFKIRMADSLEDDDTSSFSFPSSSDGRWVVIVHSRDVNSIEFWLYDNHTGKRPARLPIESGKHGEVTWHGDEIFEVSFAGMGYTVSEFVHVARPDRPFEVADLLHYDEVTRIYVSFFRDGVEVGCLFEDDGSSKERFPINLESVSAVDARMTIEKVTIEGGVVTVTHRRQDGTLARELISPNILQR